MIITITRPELHIIFASSMHDDTTYRGNCNYLVSANHYSDTIFSKRRLHFILSKIRNYIRNFNYIPYGFAYRRVIHYTPYDNTSKHITQMQNANIKYTTIYG